MVGKSKLRSLPRDTRLTVWSTIAIFVLTALLRYIGSRNESGNKYGWALFILSGKRFCDRTGILYNIYIFIYIYREREIERDAYMRR